MHACTYTNIIVLKSCFLYAVVDSIYDKVVRETACPNDVQAATKTLWLVYLRNTLLFYVG